MSTRDPVLKAIALYADYHSREGEDEASWDRLMSRVFRESAEMLCATRQRSGRGRASWMWGAGSAASWPSCGSADGTQRGGPSPAVVAAATRKGRPVRLGTLEEFGGESRVLRRGHDVLCP